MSSIPNPFRPAPSWNSSPEKRKAVREFAYSAWRALRDELADACGWVCTYCGCKVFVICTDKGGPDLATIDHKLPLSRGGTWDRPNLAIACRGCNTAKGAMTVDEFLASRAKQ